MNRIRSSTRGDQTREALLEAAIDIFGRDGFHAASTRAIAQAAGVNQALIGYHFGGKQGLYMAVCESFVEAVTAGILPVIEQVVGELDLLEKGAPQTADTALRCLETLMSAVIKQLAEASASNWPRLLAREQQDPTAAFDVIYERFYSRLLGLMTRLVGLLIGKEATSPAARARAMMILGQIIGFVAARATALRHMGWQELGPEELQLVQEQLLASLRDQFGENRET